MDSQTRLISPTFNFSFHEIELYEGNDIFEPALNNKKHLHYQLHFNKCFMSYRIKSKFVELLIKYQHNVANVVILYEVY